MSESELKIGQVFIFMDKYETVEAKLSFGKTLGGYRVFKLWFNGAFILISETFAPVDARLKELIDKYQLVEHKSK